MRQDAYDYYEQVFLPSLPRWMPRALAFQCFRKAATRLVFAESVDAIHAAAIRESCVPIGENFAVQQRLNRLLDMSDAMSGGATFTDISVIGAWPKPPFVAVSFHFGTGLAALAELRRNGTPCAFISRKFDAGEFQARPMLARAVEARLSGIARATAHPIVFRGGNYENMKALLDSGVSVCGLIDTPARTGQRAIATRLFDRTVYLPTGLLRLASEAKVPLVIFSATPNLADGSRIVRIDAPMPADHMQQLADSAMRHLEERIRALPAAWSFWPQLAELQSPR